MCPGEGSGNPLQYSCLENPRDGRAWWAAVCGVAQSQIQLMWLSSSSSSSSLCQGLPRWHTGSVVMTPRLGCPTASGISVPQSGIKPTSPAMEGRFLTTGPPEKSLSHFSYHVLKAAALGSAAYAPSPVHGHTPLHQGGLFIVITQFLFLFFFFSLSSSVPPSLTCLPGKTPLGVKFSSPPASPHKAVCGWRQR